MSLLTTLSTSLKHEEEIRRNIIKIKNELINHQISSMCVFRRVPIDYYDKTLGERGALLRCRPEQLCKSILFENTLCNHNNCEDIHDSRYYVVVGNNIIHSHTYSFTKLIIIRSTIYKKD
jgi:hypothetical protein